ncbi:MAG: amino acid permease [Proteobacteria bacterium]|nr:amino acid permease [Pseudomonadota bacterium]
MLNLSETPRKRVLSIFSLVMINVIAVDSLRSLPIGAEYGFSLVFFYLVAAIIFFIPTALASAELSTTWPNTGGIYIWVREAFGPRCGFFTIWLQWIYNIVWYPTILAFLAGTFAYLIDPTLAENQYYLWGCVIGVFWFATFLNFFGMRISSWISALGALIGTILPMIFIIGLGVVWLAIGNTSQIHFEWKTFLPGPNEMKNLAFFTGILFGLVGIEMSGVHAEEVKNPQRSYPLALLYSALIILASLVFSSLAIAIVVPHETLSLVSGLVDAYNIFFSAYNMSWMTPVIVILIILGGLSSVSAWIIGPTKGLLAATYDIEVPAILKKVNQYGAPIPLLILQGIIFTLLCSIFLLMPSVNSSYWILSTLTAQLGMFVYIFMFAAVIYLRYNKPDEPRPFKIPGLTTVWVIGIVGILACLIAVVLGFLPPKEIGVSSVWVYELILILGIVILSSPPVLVHLVRRSRKKL